ncbi:hypothetical protein RB653_000079 [Dictyostelium firmibasis]|uniref:Alpha/beta hydrolase fold-3 domain-containing protein n=1 Tax=Dictyostelium firmibasis TaxID=79012 RepID=A0AAN7YU24_9MYCE
MACKNFSLERDALNLCEDSMKGKPIQDLKPEEARDNFVKIQSGDVYKYPCNIEDIKMDLGGELGSVNVRILTPPNAKESNNTKLPVINFIHGGGWVMGDHITHDKLIREICYRTNSLVIFTEYSRPPEVKYPIQNEQCYSVFLKILKDATKWNIDINNISIVGDSAGGNMTIVLALMAKIRNGPTIKRMVLYYPAIDGEMNSSSYKEFGNDFYLTKGGMKWFWDSYINHPNDSNEIFCCPSKCKESDVVGFPETMILNGEADVLCDEGENFARLLRKANVPVTHLRFQAMIHDFVALNCLDQSKACRAAMDSSIDFLNKSHDQNATKPKC